MAVCRRRVRPETSRVRPNPTVFARGPRWPRRLPRDVWVSLVRPDSSGGFFSPACATALLNGPRSKTLSHTGPSRRAAGRCSKTLDRSPTVAIKTMVPDVRSVARPTRAVGAGRDGPGPGRANAAGATASVKSPIERSTGIGPLGAGNYFTGARNPSPCSSYCRRRLSAPVAATTKAPRSSVLEVAGV